MLQLYMATLDNTGNNNTTCKTIEWIHIHRGLEWNSKDLQLLYVDSYNIFICTTTNQLMFLINFRCLAHIVNLGNIYVMAQITKLTAVENATAIWEYDPTKADNRVLGGSLDVIAAIHTLAIKVKIEFYSHCKYLLQL